MTAKKWVLKHSPALLEPLGARKKGAALMVLRELAFAAIDDEGHGALRRQLQIAGDTGLSQRQVQRVLGELERLDMIRRHKGERSHCPQCARARRGMVVYDVVIAPEPEQLRPGQETLLFGVLTDDTVSSVAKRDQRRGVAGTDDVVSSLNDYPTTSKANNTSLKGSSFDESADSPLRFEFRTAATGRRHRAGADRPRGRRSRSSSVDRPAIQVPSPTSCALLGREESELRSLFDLWDPIADQLKAAVPESTWHIWLVNVHPHAIGAGRLVLGTPEDVALWVSGRFGRLITKAAWASSGHRLALEVVPCLGAPSLAEGAVA